MSHIYGDYTVKKMIVFVPRDSLGLFRRRLIRSMKKKNDLPPLENRSGRESGTKNQLEGSQGRFEPSRNYIIHFHDFLIMTVPFCNGPFSRQRP